MSTRPDLADEAAARQLDHWVTMKVAVTYPVPADFVPETRYASDIEAENYAAGEFTVQQMLEVPSAQVQVEFHEAFPPVLPVREVWDQ